MNTILRKALLIALFQLAMLFIKMLLMVSAQVVQQGLGISGGETGEGTTGAREYHGGCGRGL